MLCAAVTARLEDVQKSNEVRLHVVFGMGKGVAELLPERPCGSRARADARKTAYRQSPYRPGRPSRR